MPTRDGMAGVPLVADGVIYQSGSLGKVFANDLRTGAPVWSFDAHIQFPLGVVPAWGARLTRGLALWEDNVITATGDCRLIALDRKTGKERWQAHACEPEQGYTITGAPRVGGNKVFIGNANADSGANRGYVNAFDARTGQALWRFYTIPGDPSKGFENKAMEMAAKTWGKEYWKKTGGGSAWDAITYDPKLNLLYVGTDGPSPINPKMRGEGAGDELFTNAIVALDANTGEYRWHYSTTPGDGWNYDAAMHIMIADLMIGGGERRVVMTAPKNGFFYVLDAKSGKLISATNIVPTTWASHVDLKSGRPVKLIGAEWWRYEDRGTVVYPGVVGAHSWMPMSYSPQTGLVYIPIMEVPTLFRKERKNALGGAGIDYYYALDNKLPFRASLLAWDPLKQRPQWKNIVGLPYAGGVLSTAGNLVIQGTSEGELVGYRATTGERLWSMFVGSGIVAAPSTVEIDGVQLIIVAAGSGTTSAIGAIPRLSASPGGPALLLAFKLDGNAKIVAERALTEPFGSPPRPRAEQSQIERGKQVWDTNGCELCHGYQVIAGKSSVPDLRRSTEQTYELFPEIILGGLYAFQGMPTYSGTISAKDLNALQSYVLSEAWRAYDAPENRKAPH